jgi:hypothetical protein
VQFSDCNSDYDYLNFITESGTVSINTYYLSDKYNYQPIIPGLATINIKNSNDSVLFNSVMELEKAKPYTFLAYGTQSRVQGMLLHDTIPDYSVNNSYFRFVNLANGTLANDSDKTYIMFRIKGTYAISMIQPFKSASKFYPSYSGVYSIDILNAMNDSLLITKRNMSLEPGKSYTFVLRGYYKGFGNQKLNLWIIESDFLLNLKEE